MDIPPEASPGSSISIPDCFPLMPLFLSIVQWNPPPSFSFTFAVHKIHRPHAELSVHCILMSLFFRFLCFFFIIPVFLVPIFSICDASVSIPVVLGPGAGQSAQLKGLSESMQGVYMGENDFIWETSLFWYLQNSLNCWWTGLCGFAAGNLIRAKAKSPPWLSSSVTVSHVMWWDDDGLFSRYFITHIRQQPQVTEDRIGSDRLMLSLSLRPNIFLCLKSKN